MTEEELELTEEEAHNALNPDKAIEKPEDDRLGRSKFAHDLALAITSYDREEPFTVGIYGKWGSGKTSVLNMALTEVNKNKNKNNVVFRFNPWLCNSVQQMISQFFIQLKDLLETKSKSRFSKVADALETYGDAISTISGAVPVLGNIVGGANGAYKSYREAKNDFENLKNIQRLKKDVDDALRKKKAIKIVVVIDDIDRLNKEEIMAVFQLVKALADFPRMFYILAFDKDIVTQALAEIQGGKDKKYGEAYLEKIIQVLIPLPKTDVYMIANELKRRIENIVGDAIRVFLYPIVPIVNSLRDVCRLENGFILMYAMLKEQTNPNDLLYLTAIQDFLPEVYVQLPAYKNYLCGDFLLDGEDEAKKQRELLSFAPAAQQDWLKRILADLFPRFAYGQLERIDCRYHPKSAKKGQRISCPAYFSGYFTFLADDVDKGGRYWRNGLEYLCEREQDEQLNLLHDILSDEIKVSQFEVLLDEEFSEPNKLISVLLSAAAALKPEVGVSNRLADIIVFLARKLSNNTYYILHRLFTNVPSINMDIAYLVLRDIRADGSGLEEKQMIKLKKDYMNNFDKYGKQKSLYLHDATILKMAIMAEHIQDFPIPSIFPKTKK